MEKKIERVCNLGEVGVTRHGQPRQSKFLVLVEWQEGSKQEEM